MQNWLVIMLIGLPIGVLMGLTSFTGAVIVPSLVLLWGVAQAKAQGTAVMLTMSPLQVPAMWNFHRAGNIDWRMVKLLIPGVIVGTYLGSYLANALPPIVLKSIFASMLVYVGAYMLIMLTTTNVAKGMVLAIVATAITGGVVIASKWQETPALEGVTP